MHVPGGRVASGIEFQFHTILFPFRACSAPVSGQLVPRPEIRLRLRCGGSWLRVLAVSVRIQNQHERRQYCRSTGQRIVEYVTVSEPLKRKSPQVAARDLQLNDVPMTLSSPRLHVNGKNWEWNRGDAHGQVEGSVVWIYVPDRGRFLFSFTARSGYRKAGEVRGRKVKFEWNGESYELDNGNRVFPGGRSMEPLCQSGSRVARGPLSARSVRSRDTVRLHWYRNVIAGLAL